MLDIQCGETRQIEKQLIFQVTQNAKIVDPLKVITVDRGKEDE